MSTPTQYQKYIDDKLNSLLEALVTELLLEQPQNPSTFIISKLCEREGITDPLSRNNEKNEIQERMIKDSSRTTNDSESDDDSNEENEGDTDLPDASTMSVKRKMRLSVSAEAYGAWNKKEDFIPPVFSKTEEQTERLKEVLMQSFMFSTLDEKSIFTLIDAMKEKRVEAHAVLINQGEDGDCLYVVEKGDLDCQRVDDEGSTKLFKTVCPGDVVGELALLYNAPRAATVIPRNDCILWELGRDTFNHIVKDAARKKREKYEEFLKKVHILQKMNSYERAKIADALKTEIFTDGEYIVKQGEKGDVFYFIEEGRAVATKCFGAGQPCIEVLNYEEGDYFGELALITGEPRAANVLAVGKVVVASLDRRSFKRLLGSIEDLMSKKAEDYK